MNPDFLQMLLKMLGLDSNLSGQMPMAKNPWPPPGYGPWPYPPKPPPVGEFGPKFPGWGGETPTQPLVPGSGGSDVFPLNPINPNASYPMNAPSWMSGSPFPTNPYTRATQWGNFFRR